MTTTITRPACLDHTELFQHPLVEGDRKSIRRSQAQKMIAAARSVCHGCPLAQQCLFDAVVRQDVAGVAGGTTVTERQQIRRQLGVKVEDAGVGTIDGRLASGNFDPQYVQAQRDSHPEESLEGLARRLGVSLSTVKRLLRKARVPEAVAASGPLPSPEVVWHLAHVQTRRAA